MTYLGKFISIEGIDYTGKSTICKKISTKLLEKDLKVTIVSDPPSIQPWKNFKEFFEKQQEIVKISEAIFLLSSRLDNYERVIKPALTRGEVIISDRYVDSWFAYQSYRLKPYFSNIDKALDFLLNVNKFFCDNSLICMPDITILIDDDPQLTLERIKYRENTSKYNDVQTQQEIQKIYLKIAKIFSSRYRIINARYKNIDEIFKEAYVICKDILE